MKKIFFIFLMLTTLSCDEIDKIFNPSSDYLIEKTVKPSSEEQTIESGSEFKIIFPANSISNNLEVKVKKESSAPTMNIPNQKPGKNFFKIKFSGDVDFLKPVNIIINFDKSAIPNGKTAQESVFGYIYSSGAWKLADYQLDEANEKIIISISSISGKINKDMPELQADGEILIGNSILDQGQNDNEPLFLTNEFQFGEFPPISSEVTKYDKYESGSIVEHTIQTINAEDSNLLSSIALYSNKIKWNNYGFSNSFYENINGHDIKYESKCTVSKDCKTITLFSAKGILIVYSNINSNETESVLEFEFEVVNIPFQNKYLNEEFYFTLNKSLNTAITKLKWLQKDYFTYVDENGILKHNLVKVTAYSKLDWDNSNEPNMDGILLYFHKNL